MTSCVLQLTDIVSQLVNPVGEIKMFKSYGCAKVKLLIGVARSEEGVGVSRAAVFLVARSPLARFFT